MPHCDEWALCAAKRPIRCGKKIKHQDGLADVVIRHQKSDGNAVLLVKSLDHVDLGFRVSCLFIRFFGETENDDYGYDNSWDNDYEIDNDNDIDSSSRAGG